MINRTCWISYVSIWIRFSHVAVLHSLSESSEKARQSLFSPALKVLLLANNHKSGNTWFFLI